MRPIIAGLVVSLDGFVEGPDGEMDWVDVDEADPFDLRDGVDTFVLGGGMYPGYEAYWDAVLTRPHDPLPFTGAPPTEAEVEFARVAERTPHVVLSTTLREVRWPQTRVVRDVDAIRQLKEEPGKAVHALGGASLLGTLMNAHLVDELRLIVRPVVLGGGKALFGGVRDRHALTLRATEPRPRGAVRLTYGV
jgi:dihydrofolate reductase